MPTATIRELLVAAYTEIGVLGEGTAMSASQGTLGLAAVNRWIDALGADSLQMHAIIRETWTIVSGTSTYSMSSIGSPTIVPPVYIDHVNFQDTSLSPVTEFPMTPLTDDAYAAIVMKAQQSTYPQSWWYNRDFPASTMFLWPVPTSSTLEGVMYAKVPVQEFANLSTAVQLPPGYQQMIVKNMALQLLPSFEVNMSPTGLQLLVQQAQEALVTVERSNKKLSDLSLDGAAVIQGRNRFGGWSIYTGP